MDKRVESTPESHITKAIKILKSLNCMKPVSEYCECGKLFDRDVRNPNRCCECGKPIKPKCDCRKYGKACKVCRQKPKKELESAWCGCKHPSYPSNSSKLCGSCDKPILGGESEWRKCSTPQLTGTHTTPEICKICNKPIIETYELLGVQVSKKIHDKIMDCIFSPKPWFKPKKELPEKLDKELLKLFNEGLELLNTRCDTLSKRIDCLKEAQ